MNKNKIHELAMNGATKLCNCEACFVPFPCERKKWHPRQGSISSLTPIGNDTECRLKAYPVKEDTNKKPWYERKRTEYEITYDELAAICAECSYARVAGKEIIRSDQDYYNHCLDCPVQMTREAMDEASAEAANS